MSLITLKKISPKMGSMTAKANQQERRGRGEMEKLPLPKAFQLIEPGPVVLVTTVSGRKKNIMTISWHMVMDFTPRIAMVTGPWNYSFAALMKSKECVIAIPTVDLSAKVVGIGACSGSDTDKFAMFALTPVKAKSVKAPLIAECLANIECRVVDHIRKHSIIVLDAVNAWIDAERKERRTFHARGDGTFAVDGRTINYRKLMLAKLPPGV
jgi:flavin reductase (DIM6/NTAB) family NADH-FMN oxidoreductase RutF